MSCLGIVDYSQIEARILAWLAGQDDLVQQFAEGRDVYSEFASKLFSCKIRKPIKDDPESIKSFLTIRRGFGKDAILGAGYGMGGAKFFDRCKQNPDLGPAIKLGKYDFQFIGGLVKTYRQTYSKIPEFWNQVEKAFRWVIKYRHERLDLPDILGICSSHSRLSFWSEEKTVVLQLPSGRCLFYPHSSINKKDTILWRWGKLWGGAIVENIVQAIARDILAEAILRLEQNKFRVILNIHDSLIVCLEQKEQLAKIIEIMCVSPTWAVGLPITAEGKVSKYLI